MAEPANGGVSWLQVVDKNLTGWLSYLQGRRDPAVATVGPSGAPSGQEVQLAVLQTQLQAQQQQSQMLLLAAGAAVVLYLMTK